jgi:hypothetical protein
MGSVTLRGFAAAFLSEAHWYYSEGYIDADPPFLTMAPTLHFQLSIPAASRGASLIADAAAGKESGHDVSADLLASVSNDFSRATSNPFPHKDPRQHSNTGAEK